MTKHKSKFIITDFERSHVGFYIIFIIFINRLGLSSQRWLVLGKFISILSSLTLFYVSYYLRITWKNNKGISAIAVLSIFLCLFISFLSYYHSNSLHECSQFAMFVVQSSFTLLLSYLHVHNT